MTPVPTDIDRGPEQRRPAISDSSILDAANHYMQVGWRIIPLHRVGPDGKTCSCKQGARCSSAGKHPKALDWSAAAPMSGPDIYATWDVQRPPNLGTVTGTPSDIWVLDVDGAEGQDALRRLIADNGPLPKTRLHKTGSGGFHFIFKMTDGFKPKTDSNVLKPDYPRLDVRGIGGQIVLPPSRSDTGDYVVVRDVEPIEAPAWLLAIIPQVDDERPPLELAEDDLLERDQMTDAEKRTADRYIDSALAGVASDLEALPRPWHEGAGWDKGVHKAACRLFELAQQSWSKLTYVDAYALLDGHAPRDAEWGPAEIEAKWLAAQNTVGKKPMPRPKGEADGLADWDFKDRPAVTGVTVEIEERPAPAKGELEPASPRRKRRLRVKFDSDQAFSEPDDKGKQQFQAYDTAKAIKEVVHVANGDDGQLWAHMDGLWTPQAKIVQDALTLTLKNSYKPPMVAEVTHHIESRSPQMTVGPTPNVINFTNGMLHWRTGELTEHDPAQFSTTQLPHAWSPDAACPTFDQFLEESLDGPDAVRLAWEAVAIALYSGNPIQRAILLHGLPGSGKSVFLDVIAGLLGQENVSRVTLQGLSGRFNAAELYGRAANICADIDATKISETGAFKMIVAGDTVQGERKNKDPFTFRPFATLFFSANEIPGSEDRTGAWTRRFAIIHFPRARQSDEKVLGFQNVLLQEAEGIIAKALKILPDVLLRGDYSVIQKDQDDFERKTNYLLQFMDDELELDLSGTDEEFFVPTSEIRNRYNLWTAEEGYDHPATWKKVTETLAAKGLKSGTKRYGGGVARGWFGCRLLPRSAPAPVDPFNQPT